MTSLKNKNILITGGTGSFGNALVNKLEFSDIGQIKIFSRDEKKQDDMRKIYSGRNIKFYLGDVRDYKSIINAMDGVNYVFHAAAYKQVPSCEFYPMEAVKTNIIGTENVLNAAINYGIEKVVCLSTDKAVYPINAMGISKALMEKVAVAKSRNSKNTQIMVTRYGNVMGSRGSVIPLFYEQIKSAKPLTITDPNMTRFMMTLDNAVELVMYAFENGKNGEIFVQKTPSAKIEVLANAICKYLNENKCQIRILGTRHGEKKHEVLLSKEERSNADELEKYFKIKPDIRDLDYEKYTTNGKAANVNFEEYASNTVRMLNEDELVQLLKLIQVDFDKVLSK